MSHSGSVMPSLLSSWSAWIVLQVRQGDALQWERSECQEFANRHISMSLSVYPIIVYFSILSGKLQDMDIVPSSFDAQLPHERKACTELLMAKSYSIALLAHSREQPHSCHMHLGSSTAAPLLHLPKCHQKAMICFKARLLMRSAYATKDSSRTWKTSIQRKTVLRCTEYWNCKLVRFNSV